MFFPSPSPLPLMRQTVDPSGVVKTVDSPTDDDTIAVLSRHRFYCLIRWSIIPLTLMLLASTTRFWTHPAVFDLLSMDGDHEWTGWFKVSMWSLHEPHEPMNRLATESTFNHFVARHAAITPAPTVPTDPVLPTPFPQPFDTTLSSNFSTNSCYDFFLNMTQADAFRTCRPLSLLLSTSYAFLQAQNNISLMNADIWGTCNTVTSQVQCDTNMSWFASSLEASCQTDLSNQVATAVLTLNALRSFDLMRDVACQVDPMSNTYCFVEAVADTDLSSYWFYQLPLGQPLGPNVTTNACNACTSQLMASYASALTTNGTSLGGLAQTYDAAVETLNNVCGPSYAKKVQTSTSNAAWVYANVPRPSSVVMLSLLVLFAGMVCGG